MDYDEYLNKCESIVEMGLFTDADGIPIAFGISPGNSSEQNTLIPLERKMLQNFDLSSFIVCTDAGLSSATNRWFNSYDKEDGCRSFITTQSIKKLKSHLRQWSLAPQGWKLSGEQSGKTYDIRELDEENDKEKIFFKSRWVKEKAVVRERGKQKAVVIEQQLIVFYSIKYRDYLRSIRDGQIERAKKMIAKGEAAIGRKRQNDPKRFIKTDHATADGEAADTAASYIDQSIIASEEQYDGFYAVCTNLEDTPESIVKVNKRRWELEKKLDEKYTIDQIISTLQEMDFMKYEGKGYQPVYTRTQRRPIQWYKIFQKAIIWS